MMQHHSQGFTLIEVLIALAILVSSVFVLSDLRIRSIFRVMRDREKIEKAFLIKNELYKAFLRPPKEEKPVIANYPENVLMITTMSRKLLKDSLFASLKDQLSLIRSEGKWVGDAGQKRALEMITVVVKKQKQKKKKK